MQLTIVCVQTTRDKTVRGGRTPLGCPSLVFWLWLFARVAARWIVSGLSNAHLAHDELDVLGLHPRLVHQLVRVNVRSRGHGRHGCCRGCGSRRLFFGQGGRQTRTPTEPTSQHAEEGAETEKHNTQMGRQKVQGDKLTVWAVVIMVLDREEDLTQQQRIHDRTRRLPGDQRTKKGKNLASAVRERTCPSREVRQTQSYHPHRSPLNTLGRIQERPRNPTYLFSDELSTTHTVYPTSVPAYVHVIYVFLFFPPPSPPHCTPGIVSRDAVWRGGAWSARTRHGTLRRCRRVWKAVRLVAVVPRRVGAVPGSAGFSIPFSFFLPSGM